MLGLDVIYKAKKGKRDEFLKKINEHNIPALSKAEDGNVQYDYFLSIENDDDILLLEKWADENEQKSHTQTAHCSLLQTIKAELIESTVLEKYTL